MQFLAVFVPGLMLSIGAVGMLLGVVAWVKMARRARRGVSNEALWWRPRSPSGGEMFSSSMGRPHDVADYVPSYLLGPEAAGHGGPGDTEQMRG
ncbi:MAG TPA: hypothetical protein VNA14_07120 [Mycobacteriales bacterium]|nr:hypothetical protein [Mycobacteriales bacterium]